MKIVFIAAHLAGGAGKAIVGMCNYMVERDLNITILSLEETQNKFYLNQLNENIRLIVNNEGKVIQSICKAADVVVLNWWAHPLMFPVLLLLEQIPIRAALWIHINGCGYPALESDFLLKAHQIFFTCSYSYENELLEKDLKRIKCKSTIIYGIGKFEPQTIRHKDFYLSSETYRIGYLGTLDYNKLNAKYINACECVAEKISNVEFLLYGECTSELIEDINRSTIKEKFKLMGFSNDPIQSLMSMDVLAYPLNPVTSGTTENVILEAMAAGVPIVALNQGTEKNIIKNEENGILADDMRDFPNKVIELISDADMRERVGIRAREYVIQKYEGRKNADRFITELKKVLRYDKKCVTFSRYIGETPYEWFLSCCGACKGKVSRFVDNDEICGIEEILTIIGNESKSSVQQFFRYYPEDEKITKICNRFFPKHRIASIDQK